MSFNFGAFGPGGVHAPSATPDGKGGIYVIFNMNPAKPTEGWNQIMTLPRRLTLQGTDKIGRDTLLVEPAGDVESLRREHRQMADLTLPSNQEIVLGSIRGDAIELLAEIETNDAPLVELNVLRSPGKEEFTRIAFYRERGLPRLGAVQWLAAGQAGCGHRQPHLDRLLLLFDPAGCALAGAGDGAGFPRTR